MKIKPPVFLKRFQDIYASKARAGGGLEKTKNAASLQQLWSFLAPRHLVRFAKDTPISDPLSEKISDDALKKADIILLMGSNDLTPARQAVKLYKQIAALGNGEIKIVASGKGGYQDPNGGHLTVPADRFTVAEAVRYAEELKSLGIPQNAIILEPESKNSGENVRMSHAKLKENGIEAKRIILIQTPAAQLRANLTFEKQWPAAWEYYISYPPDLSQVYQMSEEEIKFHLTYALREILTTINYFSNPDSPFATKRTLPPSIVKIICEHYNRDPQTTFPLDPQNFLDFLKDPPRIEKVMGVFRNNFEQQEKDWVAFFIK